MRLSSVSTLRLCGLLSLVDRFHNSSCARDTASEGAGGCERQARETLDVALAKSFISRDLGERVHPAGSQLVKPHPRKGYGLSMSVAYTVYRESPNEVFVALAVMRIGARVLSPADGGRDSIQRPQDRERHCLYYCASSGCAACARPARAPRLPGNASRKVPGRRGCVDCRVMPGLNQSDFQRMQESFGSFLSHELCIASRVRASGISRSAKPRWWRKYAGGR
jgi:hypothetical protein